MKFDESTLQALRSLVPEPVEIVGGGLEGQSTARFLLSAGYERLTLRDRNPEVKAPLSVTVGDATINISGDPKYELGKGYESVSE
jgi:prephenate dehydrogenase